MDIFGISDLHLPGGEDKPMDVFGTEWSGHAERVATAWKDLVAPDDLVLVPGDLSWAMKLPAVQGDLDFLGTLPGTIVLVKGNHDLWWKSISQLRQRLPANVFALQNDFYQLPGQLAVCGTRGWKSPGAADFTPDDEKIYRRELERLRLSLQTAQDRGCRPYIVMLHYPPTAEGQTESELTELMEAAGAQYCIYGHLHGPAQRQALTGTHRGIAYHLVACDAIGFKPLYVTSLPG
ncbi:MAG: metallophosphoesterase [Limnochordia bacterium]